MKTYIGLRGRDRVMRMWVENYGQRSPMASDDVAGRILADVFGPRLIEDEYWCYQAFRDDVIGRMDDTGWSLSESDVREWRDAYTDQKALRESLASSGETPLPAPSEEKASEPIDQHTLVSWGTGISRARLLRVTPSVLLLEGARPTGLLLTTGDRVRVGLPGQPRMVAGRLAAFGTGGRFLVAVGSRAVRGDPRRRVDLQAVVRAAALGGAIATRIVDLSNSGARLFTLQLPIGSTCDLSFVPPGRTDRVTLRCDVVRAIDAGKSRDLGVAFCGGALSLPDDQAPKPV